jgi:UDP-N-acetylmuramoyl-tripeptide--D-alanyl-D-alanine ligase
MIRTLGEFAAACGGRLVGQDRSFDEVAIDSRRLNAGNLFAALAGARIDGHQFVADAAARGAAGALVQRQQSVPLAQILVDDVEVALARAAHAVRTRFSGPVVGVAGSNGKTTVKEMLAAILAQRGPCLATRGNLNNHLGVPMTLLRLAAEHRSAVIEMGANRAGDVAALVRIARPDVGLITNAGAEHLEGFGSLEGAARAEGEMVADLPASATAVLNADDAFFASWRAATAARVVSFGMVAPAQFTARQLRLELTGEGYASSFELHTPLGQAQVRLALAGRHNVLNALAAAAAAASAGATLGELCAGLAQVRAVRGRLQLRRRADGGWLIDDSYNANPSSVRAGLAVLAQMPAPRWLVLGDMAELGEFAAASHHELGELARRMGVERLYTHGPLAALAAASFGAGAAGFEDAAALLRALEAALTPQATLLIKGSRVNRLERIVEALAPLPAEVQPAGAAAAGGRAGSNGRAPSASAAATGLG